MQSLEMTLPASERVAFFAPATVSTIAHRTSTSIHTEQISMANIHLVFMLFLEVTVLIRNTRMIFPVSSINGDTRKTLFVKIRKM